MISVLELLRDLRRITSTERGSTRLAYTHHEDAAHDLLSQRMSTLKGLSRVEDAAGNLFIVPDAALEESHTPLLLVGSHLDTVIEGGWLDGTLGVAAGAHALSRLAAAGRAHPRVGLVVFRDEEGVRFNTGLFGSRVFAGLCTERDLDATDANGVRVRDVVPDPAGCVAYRAPIHAAAFFECHIEQGLRLVNAKQQIGVVTGMVGIRRYALRATGEANHAGTTEMRRRRDALVPVARVIADLPGTVADLDEAVATCGRISIHPGAPNIVPGRAEAVIEIRAGDAATMDRIESRVRDLVVALDAAPTGGRSASVQLEPIVNVEPLVTDAALARDLTSVLTERRVAHRSLLSMAGHDTQHAAHRCPSGMFFIPSIGGVSHSPEEDSTEDDIAMAGDVMTAWVERCLTSVAQKETATIG